MATFTYKLRLAQHDSEKPSVASRLLSHISYLVPFVLFLLFLLDVSDWIVNQESVVGPSGGFSIQGKQSRIITILSYMRSQFTYFLSATTTLIFSIKLKKICECKVLLKNLYLNLSVSSAVNSRRRRLPRRVIGPCLTLVCLGSLDIFRFLYYFFTNSNSPWSWELKIYSVMRIPAGIFDVFFGLAILLAELIPLILYGGFILLASLLTESCLMFNKMLKKTILDMEVDSRHPDAVPFEESLACLTQTSRRISTALEELDSGLSAFLFVALIGNCLLLASILARCFVTAFFKTVMTYVLYATVLLPPLVALVLIVNVCATLNESVMESVRIWQDLVVARQAHRQLVYRSDEGEKLLTILHRTTNGHHSLTVAGTAHVTRSFGVSLVCGFVGLMCFLIERSEHYQTEESVQLVKSLNCSNYAVVE